VFIERKENFMRQVFKATDGKEFQTQEEAIAHENVALAEKTGENYRRARVYGILSCLDIIFLYDQPSMAIEIISQEDHKGLVKIAAEDEYIYLPQITEIIKEIERRSATP
jgi:hypothetical protein